MAGIDKTYTDSYTDYKEFKDWADKQYVTFFDSHTKCIGDWVWDLSEEDFKSGEIPIMNTPTWLDVYLIRNCTIRFVIDRMKEVYGDSFKEYKRKTILSELPVEYKQNRKIVIKSGPGCIFPIDKKPYKKPAGKSKYWWLQCLDINYGYNEETKTWIDQDLLYPTNTNTSHHKSTKSLIRFLRKQYLPKGLEFRLIGSYVGEEYKVIIK